MNKSEVLRQIEEFGSRYVCVTVCVRLCLFTGRACVVARSVLTLTFEFRHGTKEHILFVSNRQKV